MTAEFRFGTQGWNYDAWEGPFYPEKTRASDYLTVYARAFDTVEVDSTFYATPAESTVKSWVARTPPGFLFALKMPQEVTHEHRLREVTGAESEFYARVRQLGDKLGPILVQLGPDFDPSELPALVDFTSRVPTDLKVSIEFRHRGWITEGVIALLRDRNIGIALVDGRWLARKTMRSLALEPTSNFAYIRWMGPNRDIIDYSRVQADRTYELDLWTETIQEMASKVETVFGYVANTFSGHSPATVRELQSRFGLTPVSPELLGEQISFF